MTFKNNYLDDNVGMLKFLEKKKQVFWKSLEKGLKGSTQALYIIIIIKTVYWRKFEEKNSMAHKVICK